LEESYQAAYKAWVAKVPGADESQRDKLVDELGALQTDSNLEVRRLRAAGVGQAGRRQGAHLGWCASRRGGGPGRAGQGQGRARDIVLALPRRRRSVADLPNPDYADTFDAERVEAGLRKLLAESPHA
jgi:hypothetical protein